MNWFLVGLIAPILWAVTNHFDKYLISRYFKGGGIGALMIFSAAIGFFLLPIIYLIEPGVLSVQPFFIAILILNGFLYVIGLLPYLYAIEEDEASVVVPLFQLIPLFSYVLALIVLDEKLTSLQIIASLLIIAGAVLISTNFDKGKRRFKAKVFWFMFLASFLVALNGLVYKIFAIKESYWTSGFWEYVGFSIFAVLLIVFVKSYRKQFLFVFKNNKVIVLSINGVNEVLNILAKLSMNFATILAPLSLAWVINGFQPFFVLFFGVMLAIFFPKLTDESLDKKHILQKVIAILVMFIGTYLLSL